MEATDARVIYTPSQAILYKSHRMFLRKIQVREGNRGRLLWSHKPAREEQRPNEQKGTVGGEGGRAANPQGESVDPLRLGKGEQRNPSLLRKKQEAFSLTRTSKT